jgi:hypothetical protein
LLKNEVLSQAPQVESVLVVQLSMVQLGIPVQPVHTRSLTGVHAALWNCPAGQPEEHIWHWPSCEKYPFGQTLALFFQQWWSVAQK